MAFSSVIRDSPAAGSGKTLGVASTGFVGVGISVSSGGTITVDVFVCGAVEVSCGDGVFVASMAIKLSDEPSLQETVMNTMKTKLSHLIILIRAFRGEASDFISHKLLCFTIFSWLVLALEALSAPHSAKSNDVRILPHHDWTVERLDLQVSPCPSIPS